METKESMDMQMAQLADSYLKTLDELDKSIDKLKDVSFVVEQKRLLALKKQAYSCFYKTTDTSNVQDIQQNSLEQACSDKLETKNIDFNHTMDSGQKQLLNTVDEAIDKLEQIKNQYLNSLDELVKEWLERKILDFKAKFPKFDEKLFMKAFKIAKMIDIGYDILYILQNYCNAKNEISSIQS